MIAWIKQLVGVRKSDPRVSVVARADHVELSSTHLVIGLRIDWGNHTKVAIPVKEILLRIYLGGLKHEPLRFYPLERFARVETQRALKKTPVRPFTLPAEEVFSEQIRFLSQEVLDIRPGSYTVEIEVKDTNDVSYTNQLSISLPSKIKYRRSEEWQKDE